MIVIQDNNVKMETVLKSHHHPNVITIPTVLQDMPVNPEHVLKFHHHHNVLVITIVDGENNVKTVNAFHNKLAHAMMIVHTENHAKTDIVEYGEKFIKNDVHLTLLLLSNKS
jgi:hypothetical protein